MLPRPLSLGPPNLPTSLGPRFCVARLGRRILLGPVHSPTAAPGPTGPPPKHQIEVATHYAPSIERMSAAPLDAHLPVVI